MDPRDDVDLAHFTLIPWCKSLINDSNFRSTKTDSRYPKEDSEDSLFGGTLNTANTISSCLTLYRVPDNDGHRIDEVRVLLTLGLGLCGYPKVCHGGLVAVFLDETMGVLLHLNKTLVSGITVQPAVTANLSVDFLKPVPIPSTIMVIARFASIEGKKHYIEALMENERGETLSRATGLWIGVGRSKSNL